MNQQTLSRIQEWGGNDDALFEAFCRDLEVAGTFSVEALAIVAQFRKTTGDKVQTPSHYSNPMQSHASGEHIQPFETLGAQLQRVKDIGRESGRLSVHIIPIEGGKRTVLFRVVESELVLGGNFYNIIVNDETFDTTDSNLLEGAEYCVSDDCRVITKQAANIKVSRGEPWNIPRFMSPLLFPTSDGVMIQKGRHYQRETPEPYSVESAAERFDQSMYASQLEAILTGLNAAVTYEPLYSSIHSEK